MFLQSLFTFAMLRLAHLKVVFWKWHGVNTHLIFSWKQWIDWIFDLPFACWFCFFIIKHKMYICTYSFNMPVMKSLNQHHLWSVCNWAMNAPQRQITAPNRQHREMTFKVLLQDSCWIPFFNQDGSGIYWLSKSQGGGRIFIING